MSNLHTSFNRSLHENNFSRLALRHYQVNAYLWQARIGGFMMEQTSLGHECRLLCIQGTGSGKSVLYQTLAAHYRSVTIYVSPLLTLGADQVNKIMQKTRLLGNTIVPIHLDAVQSDDDMAYVTSLMTSVNPQCSVLVFTSPQTITNKFPHFVASVADHVSFVVVDELHMFNAFGRSFRKEFQALKHHLFLVVKTSVPILFLTASCNKQIHASFERMIGVKISYPS